MSFQVHNVGLPARCEICHQADSFDPKTNTCARCSARTDAILKNVAETDSPASKAVSSSPSEVLPFKMKPEEAVPETNPDINRILRGENSSYLGSSDFNRLKLAVAVLSFLGTAVVIGLIVLLSSFF